MHKPETLRAETWEPMFIGDSARPLYAALHRPVLAAATGALLVPPLFHEQPRSRRFVTEVAGCLAASGLPALRFDFAGSGDSSGDSAAMDLVSMRRDLATAAAALRDLAGVRRIAVIAFRAAALPVYSWLASGGRAEAVVLWEPVLQGDDWLQSLIRQDRAERVSLDRYPLGNGPSGAVQDDQLMGLAAGSALRRQLGATRIDADELQRDRWCLEVLRPDAPGGTAEGIARRMALPPGTPSFGNTTRMNDALFMSSAIQDLVTRIGAELHRTGSPS